MQKSLMTLKLAVHREAGAKTNRKDSRAKGRKKPGDDEYKINRRETRQ